MTLAEHLPPLSNPELRRYIWSEFSPHRLVAMPALLGLLFFGADALSGSLGVDQAAKGALVALLVIWGGRQAAGAVTDEVVGGTWDAQRMSAMGPWSLTWGKLLGATAYTWYGAAGCFLALLYAGRTSLEDMVSILLAALIAQGTSLYVGILLQRGQRPTALAGTITLAQACGIAVVSVLIAQQFEWGFGQVRWWDWVIDGDLFMLIAKGLALAWMLIGVYALMREELRYRPQPWTWLAFLVFASVFAAGFADPSHLTILYGTMIAVNVVPLTVAYGTVSLLTLGAAVLASNDSVALRRWLAASTAARQRPQALFLEAPAWVLGLLASLVLAVALTAAWSAVPSPSWLPVMIWSTVVFQVRDLGVVLAVTMNSDRRRGAVGALIYLAALYVLLPLSLRGVVPDIDMALTPTLGATVTGSLLPALVQAGAAWLLVAWRWQRTGQGASATAAA